MLTVQDITTQQNSAQIYAIWYPAMTKDLTMAETTLKSSLINTYQIEIQIICKNTLGFFLIEI